MTAAGRTDDVVEIANDLVALHSSDPATVYLTALARMRTPSIQAVEAALYVERSLVRHHAMRRTLWVMTPEVASLAHVCATAKVAVAERKRTIAALADSAEIADPDQWLDAAVDAVVDLLVSNGPMTTREIGQALPHLVIPVTFGVRTKHPAAMNAHVKVLQGAGFDATVIRARPTGKWNSSEYNWSATKSWLGHEIATTEVSPDMAASDLLNRWLLRFGPATETDIRWWFGWTARLTRVALSGCNAREVLIDDGRRAFLANGDDEVLTDPGPWVRLLPGLDPTAMGWKERDWYLDPDLVTRTFDNVGNAGPTVWADGRIVGTWIQSDDGDIVVDLAVKLDADHQALLDQAIEDLVPALGDVVVRPRFPVKRGSR